MQISVDSIVSKEFLIVEFFIGLLVLRTEPVY